MASRHGAQVVISRTGEDRLGLRLRPSLAQSSSGHGWAAKASKPGLLGLVFRGVQGCCLARRLVFRDFDGLQSLGLGYSRTTASEPLLSPTSVRQSASRCTRDPTRTVVSEAGRRHTLGLWSKTERKSIVSKEVPGNYMGG